MLYKERIFKNTNLDRFIASHIGTSVADKIFNQAAFSVYSNCLG
jgi:hypothetical protein